MARVILITGGSRSGKSAYAQRLVEDLAGERVFVATCPVLDEEMRRRVSRHRAARARAGWQTIEEPLALTEALEHANQHAVVLVDCLTLWVSNVMLDADRQGRAIGEDDIAEKCGEVLRVCRARSGKVVFVTNEVGCGVVPENALARRFRDLAGRCNQVMAAAADEVVFVVCGLPLFVKKGQPDGNASG